MMRAHDLTADDLRDLHSLLDPVKRTSDPVGDIEKIKLAAWRAANVMQRLRVAALNASLADPECAFCEGFGVVVLPPQGNEDDVEERQCPVCRPWGGKGFPGLLRDAGTVKRLREKHQIADDRVVPPEFVWVVEPYADGDTPKFNPMP